MPIELVSAIDSIRIAQRRVAGGPVLGVFWQAVLREWLRRLDRAAAQRALLAAAGAHDRAPPHPVAPRVL
jgi:hypothetical protein